ncbi:MAG: nucleotidyltransferase domain-containing protein [Candidatus Nanohaloarchaea archaeon]
MAERFVDLLGKEYRGQVLEFLRDNPDQMFTINEVAEKVDGSYPAVRDFLRELEDLNLLRISKKGNSYLVEFNQESRYFDAVDAMFKVETAPLFEAADNFVMDLIESDEDLDQKIVSVNVFGSVARGTADSNSDIDIFFLVGDETNTDDFKNQVVERAKNMDNEIVPVVETESEFIENYEDGKRFEQNVVRDSRWLHGDDLREKVS